MTEQDISIEEINEELLEKFHLYDLISIKTIPKIDNSIDNNKDNIIENSIDNRKYFENLIETEKNEVLFYDNSTREEKISIIINNSSSSQSDERHTIIRSGRKRNRPLQIGDKIHDKYFEDNILRKIQVHYINFIRFYINEILEILGFKVKFYDINYNIKKITNKNNISLLKSLSISDILCQNISRKFRKTYKQNKNINKIIFNKVINNDIIKGIVSEKYERLFKYVYLQNKKCININGKNIFLKKIKTFEDLLKNDKDFSTNSLYREKINEVIKKKYVKEYFKLKKY
jgi:hypothetical protein